MKKELYYHQFYHEHLKCLKMKSENVDKILIIWHFFVTIYRMLNEILLKPFEFLTCSACFGILFGIE